MAIADQPRAHLRADPLWLGGFCSHSGASGAALLLEVFQSRCQPRLVVVLAPSLGFSPHPAQEASEPLDYGFGPQRLLEGSQLLSWDVAVRTGGQAGFLQHVHTTLPALQEPALLLPGFVGSDWRGQGQRGPV